MYVTNSQLYDYVSALLHRAQANVEKEGPFWRTITDKCNADAFGYIVRGLTARGFGSVSQVPLWDDGPTYQKSIGAFFSLTEGGALGAFDDKFIARLDRREELKTVQVTINGVWQNPDGTGMSPLETGSGSLTTSNDPMGSAFSPTDPRRGQTIRW